MYYNTFFVFIFTQLNSFLCDNNTNDYYNLYVQYGAYRGEKFPQKYLSVDEVQPTMSDLSHYVKALSRVVDYFAQEPNETDHNVAIGSYFMNEKRSLSSVRLLLTVFKSVGDYMFDSMFFLYVYRFLPHLWTDSLMWTSKFLFWFAVVKRTLIDYGDKIANEEKLILLDVVHKSDDLISHYVYSSIKYGHEDLGFQLSRLLKHDDPLVYSIGKFNKNTMSKWIHSNVKLNDYIEEMDNMSLPRDKYAELVVAMEDYYNIWDSDICIASISSHPIPLKNNEELKQCRPNTHCKDRVFKLPTVAYAMSHQQLYLLGLSLARRCYVVSEEVDKTHMDILCTNMYREAVYLARRGYFYRDLFLEHIALCATLGYEEFHRSNWFKKSASWVDEDGCMAENRNFEMNRTRIYLAKVKDQKEAKRIRNLRTIQLYEECHHHQMALVVCVLAHGIRHAAHYMETT